MVNVRVATGNDAAGIARAQEHSWQRAYRHVFPVEELDRGGFIRPELWRERLEHPAPGWLTLVADEQGEVVGFVSVGPSRDERGIGELYAVLWVLEDNPRARSFYEAAGWSPDGAVKSDERWGVRAPEVRYRKSFA